MPQIPTSSRIAVRVQAPDVEIEPWTIEFVPSNVDLVRLYSVDGDPRLIIVETSDQEGALVLECYLGLHGMHREGGSGPAARIMGQLAGSLELEIRGDAADPGDVAFDLR